MQTSLYVVQANLKFWNANISLQYDELASKGNFSREDIVTMLTAHEGSSDAAFQVEIVHASDPLHYGNILEFDSPV